MKLLQQLGKYRTKKVRHFGKGCVYLLDLAVPSQKRWTHYLRGLVSLSLLLSLYETGVTLM
jgi:hypothetical protein